MSDEVKRFRRRYDEAKRIRDLSAAVIDSCYEYALPLRQRTYMMTGQQLRTDRLFDGTAVTALQGLASQTLDDVWPADQTPFELKSGLKDEGRREEANRILAAISQQIIDLTNNSNFRSAAHEMLLDWGIGTGFMTVNRGTVLTPLEFQALPLTEVVADLGPFGRVDFLTREREVRAGEIEVMWPGATIPAELRRRIEQNPDQKVKVLEGEERDWTVRNEEAWLFRVVWDGEMLLRRRAQGIGSCSFVAPSFSRVSGETLGRGPAMMALPDIRVANELKEILLEHADLILSGMFQYDDDGVFNPDTAELGPGALIPRASGSRGLEPLEIPSDLRVADLQLSETQAQIREAMFVNDLGDLGKTPRSATEVMQRTADRARRLAGAYGRLLTEWLFPQVARTWWLLRDMNGARDLPPIDGDRIRVRPLSPLTRAQAQDDILRHLRFLEILPMAGGPQASLLMVDQDKFAPWLAEKVGFNPTLLRPQIKREALAAQVAQLMAAQGAGMVGQ
ncbi:hypothetical protein GXW74_19830 [Roseomonas eburnea]|uniref:Uncharacterized protein n=1 Tax=Neoroseomonas eburnea TaxID=1346889 RepID=A0A9X9XGB6_9PROT|nr:portal protein [Neoroseomonas eburnea]MBR0682752.1 hypothetical protein [Neoroseomonas eburnea]